MEYLDDGIRECQKFQWWGILYQADAFKANNGLARN